MVRSCNIQTGGWTEEFNCPGDNLKLAIGRYRLQIIELLLDSEIERINADYGIGSLLQRGGTAHIYGTIYGKPAFFH